MPPSPAYRPDPRFAALGPEFADPVAPATFPKHILRFRNDAWAARVGLDTLDPAEWESAFARFEPLPGNMPRPLAMRYHGHQFRVYNPDIGDGRGFLYAQLRDDAGRLLDLATKGSGQTPYSRFGDGRLTLKGGVREVLAAEMLAALGVKTSKAFALFETGEALQRNDEPSPTRAAVLTRLSHSHLRFGTFQRLTYFERPDLIRVLIDHAVECYYPELSDQEGEARAAALFEKVVEASARLAASWMAAGFVHGVLNTDNMTLTGESFDYGPWRFLPTSDPNFTAAYFDEVGLYSFGRQPEAASWNLAQLAGCFSLVCDTPALERGLGFFAIHYQTGLRDKMFARLGLTTGDLAADMDFLRLLFGWMTESGIGWAQFFFDWFGGAASAARAAQSPAASHYDGAAFAPIRAEVEKRSDERAPRLDHPYFARTAPCDLLIEELEAIWAAIAERDDWTSFENKIADIRLMGAALGIQTE
ncbi:MAG: YdiU family protein [Hyphomonadaceae bacterium]|nr:YdiU family protein [Hyphomonadaceae bacterium]